MVARTRFSTDELLKRPDCGGLMGNGRCKWLHIPSCEGPKCSYYKNLNSQDKSQARLRSLDEDTQERIAQKYYNGSRPWMDFSSKSWR